MAQPTLSRRKTSSSGSLSFLTLLAASISLLGDIMSDIGYPTEVIMQAATTTLIILRYDNASTTDNAVFADWLLQSPTHICEFLLCDQVRSWLQKINRGMVVAAADWAGDRTCGVCPVPREASTQRACPLSWRNRPCSRQNKRRSNWYRLRARTRTCWICGCSGLRRIFVSD